jgi:hypothetical protein
VDQVQVIAEHNVNAPASGDDNDDDTRFVESVGGEEITEHWGKLAGIIKRD